MIGYFTGQPLPWVLGVALYIAAWIHANKALARYEAAAKQRLAEIDRQREVETDAVLEKGLLLYKVLQEKQAAVDVLTSALQMSGGDPALLNLAGVIMTKSKRYEEAAQFFELALAGARDEVLIKLINKNRAFVSKKIA
ncbi:MAG: hypothetical protein ONB15_07475 [candidate division KSB1 bacterium]|nr:hypothetical protein [candidate division KSB1 bacterium]